MAAARREMPGTVPLFDLPASSPLPRPRSKPADFMGTPKWSSYKAKNRPPCDECKIAQHEGRQHDVARMARWRRQTKGSDKLLCHEHAQFWRHEDGLDLPKAMREALAQRSASG